MMRASSRLLLATSLGGTLAAAIALPSRADDIAGITVRHADPALRAQLLRQIAAAQALPPALRRARLLALAHGLAAPQDAPAGTAQSGSELADPHAALDFAEAVLDRHPENLAARAEAVRAALALGDANHATLLASAATDAEPNAPATWMIAAEAAEASAQPALAVADLARARALRDAELASSQFAAAQTSPDQTSSDQGDGASDGGSYQTAQATYANPFRDPQSTTTAEQAEGSPAQAAAAQSAAPSDPMLRDIDSNIAALQSKLAPTAQVQFNLSGRSGQTGLSQYGTVAAPVQASFAPFGEGRLQLSATPTVLIGGKVSSSPFDQEQYGTGALYVRYSGKPSYTFSYIGQDAPYQRANGVGVDADYSYRWFEGDIGTTPLGFHQSNLDGGITLSPNLGDGISLRLVGERRPVTDSLMSYAGVVDPNTGKTMGGVMRDRALAQISIADGGGYWYAGGGYSTLSGENVASNTETEAGAGVNYPVWVTHTDEIRLGVNGIYFSYRKNLDGFTYGQGGYFSPQYYVAALLPVSYTEKLGRFTYMIQGQIGVDMFHQASSLYFPTSTALQSQLEGNVASVPGLQDSYPSQYTTGITGGAHGEFQYNVTPNLNLGGEATFARAGNFDQEEGLVYARYTFGGS